MIGNFGDAEVFSFHATKFFNTFEGGAVATNDDELAEAIRLMKNFGFAGTDNVIYVGTNGKMNEISAAMGLTSLDSIDAVIETNRRNYRQYLEELQDIPGLKLARYDEAERCNYQYVILEVDADVTGIARDQLVDTLWADNVRARRYFYPGVHRMEPYRSYFPHSDLLLPETEALSRRVMSLPTGTAVDVEDIRAICEIIRCAIANGAELTTPWPVEKILQHFCNYRLKLSVLMESKPLVSICCTAYNHEPFIRDTIEGFLMQEVDFPMEILINDDASTDRTAEILREYEQEYPELIKVVYQKENQYSKGISPLFDLLFPSARGKYIALCEGDDYWTTPHKINEQVSFMEAQPECVVTSGGFSIDKCESHSIDKNNIDKVFAPPTKGSRGFWFDLIDAKRHWYTKTLTLVFRNGIITPEIVGKYKYFKDVHLNYHLLKVGRGYYFSQVVGVYRVHPGGVYSSNRGAVNKTIHYLCSRELYKVNRDDFNRSRFVRHSAELFGSYVNEGNRRISMIEAIRSFGWAMVLARHLEEFGWIIKAMLPTSFKNIMRRILYGHDMPLGRN